MPHIGIASTENVGWIRRKTMRLGNHTLASICLLAFGAATAHADGLVTMSGNACKPAIANPDQWKDFRIDVVYLNGIQNNASSVVSVQCPITNSWGGGDDVSVQLGRMQVYFQSYSNSSINPGCDLIRTDQYGNVLEIVEAFADAS